MKYSFNEPKDRIVLALDVPTKREALVLVRELKDYVGVFKVGLQLFMSEGYSIVNALQEEGVEIFFDVKLHDIPNTVAQASASIIRHGINFFNIHSTGSLKMMSSSVELARKTALDNNMQEPTILGVTLLSSISQEILSNELGISNSLDTLVVDLAKLSKESGLSGVVASVHEAKNIRKACGKDFIILCPGIRPSFAQKNDQQRVATPKQAIEAGADFLVIGRAVNSAENKIEAMQKIYKEIEEATALVF